LPQLNVIFSKETSIPLSILTRNSSLEAIVFYLKEIRNLKFSEIASLLHRDPRTIWATYTNAKRKKIAFQVNTVIDETLQLDDTLSLDLPLSIFTSRTFSILETIVFHLKNTQNLSFTQISDLLGKNYRTIWTVYRRALKKIEHEN